MAWLRAADIGFFNPETGEHETVSLHGDAEAKRRLTIKSKYKGARCGIRYQRSVTEKIMQTRAPRRSADLGAE